MKKTILAIVLAMCCATAWASLFQGEIGLEMYGGYSFTALKNFNDNFVNVFNYGYLEGYAAPKDAAAIPGILEADLKIRYCAAPALPLYLRLGLTRLVDTEILTNTSTGKDIAASVASFNMAYAGAGAKYGFRLSRAFTLLIGADAGLYIPVASFWEVTGNISQTPPVNNNISDPLYNASQRIDFTDIYFGGNAGAGVEWAITDSWGVTIEGGYRFAKAPLTYRKKGIFARDSFNLKELDFSGPYLTGGLVLYFDGRSAVEIQKRSRI